MESFSKTLSKFGSAFAVIYIILLFLFFIDILLIVVIGLVAGAIIPAIVAALVFMAAILLIRRHAYLPLLRVLMFQFLLVFLLIPILESFLLGFCRVTIPYIFVCSLLYGSAAAFLYSRIYRDDDRKFLSAAAWMMNLLAAISGFSLFISKLMESLYVKSKMLGGPGQVLFSQPCSTSPLLLFILAFVLFIIPFIVIHAKMERRDQRNLLLFLTAPGIMVLFMVIIRLILV